MQPIEIKRRQGDGGIDVIELRGCLDAHNFEELEGVFDSYFDRGVHNLVVDISRLEYVSSAGVGVFIGAAGRAQANEGNVVAVAPVDNVREIFDLLGVSHVFPVVETHHQALAHFASLSR
jgi:anti-anti-sigma factor